MEDSDKFILVSLNDENSKFLSEVLGNKTCKKIIDFLSERKEASEKDISDGLQIPLNTTEYNLTKLVKSGIVKKTSNFFWSVKGKKIPMYKLANKHIVISPLKKPSPEILKTLLPVVAGIFIGVLIMIFYSLSLQNETPSLDSFSKSDEKYLDLSYETASSVGSGSNIDMKYSGENYIVKYDGNFVYAISPNKIFLFENSSSGELVLLSEINVSE